VLINKFLVKGLNIMSDWSPQVVKIEKVYNHPSADKLDVVTVLNDYPVITKRDEYKVNDLVAYICIDTIVPDTIDYHFLCPKAYEKYEENGEIKQRMIGPKFPVGSVPEKYRVIKAKKILGIYSQGMVVPFPTQAFPELTVGDSVVEALQLKKHEEEEEDNLPIVKARGANAAPPPKGFSIPHYDLDGARKYINCLLPDEEIVLCEKLHGCNFSACHDGEKLYVKSRNFYKKSDPDDLWFAAAMRLDLENKLKDYPHLAFFGEIVGNVKGFRYDAEIINGQLIPQVHFFDIYNTKTQRYLDYDDYRSTCKALDLKVVPELYRGLWTNKDEMYALAERQSTINPKHIAEGWVLSTVKERFEPKLNSRMKIKLISEQYNLSK
jgi:RNA ligase (TIGR02306 family)